MNRAATEAAHQTDSMKMFLMGVDGGKPADGGIGVQPEWVYKGDGAALIAPGAPLPSPDLALDAGEAREIAGIYLIACDGTPVRQIGRTTCRTRWCQYVSIQEVA